MEKFNELANNLHHRTVDTLKKLDVIWDEIGLEDDIREHRNQMFINHVETLYNDMLVEAEDSKASLLNDIETYGQEITILSKELHLNVSIDSYENVPLCAIKTDLRSRLERYQRLYNDQKAQIDKLLSQQKALCLELDEKSLILNTSPLPAADEVNNFKQHLEKLSDIKFQREEVFLKLKTEIISIMNELQIKPNLDFQRQVLSNDDSVFKVTKDNMIQLEEWHGSLLKQLEDTKACVAELREKINDLWERLEESHQIRSEFLVAHPGHSVITLRQLQILLHKLEERKKANIKQFIDKLREELNELWDRCYFSPEEKNDFTYFYSDCYTEDLLTLHEMQVGKLKSHYQNNIEIFDLYKKREELWKKMINLETKANQPDRYKNRGGQLLNEEKERKSVAAKLPKIEEELRKLLNTYEMNNGKPFLIYGQRLDELMDESWLKHKEKKQLKLSVKKKLREEISVPVRTPGRCTPSTSTSKRKLIDHSSGDFSCKKSRLEIFSAQKSASKLNIPNSSTKKMSADKKKRLEKIRERSRRQQHNETNYETFQGELEIKESCRSSLFPDKILTANKTPTIIVHGPNNTPRKVLGNVNTPDRTPMTTRLRSKSPTALVGKLTAAPSNLPIII